MSIRTLPRAEWNDYFDTFSTKSDTGRSNHAEIRVLMPEDGAQPQTRWLPLHGIAYDPKDDLLEILATGLDLLLFSVNSSGRSLLPLDDADRQAARTPARAEPVS